MELAKTSSETFESGSNLHIRVKISRATEAHIAQLLHQKNRSKNKVTHFVKKNTVEYSNALLQESETGAALSASHTLEERLSGPASYFMQRLSMKSCSPASGGVSNDQV